MNKIEEIVLKHALINAKKYGKAKFDAVISKVIAEIPESKKEIEILKKLVDSIIKKVNKLSKSEIESKIKELGIEPERTKVKKATELLPPLPGAIEGKVIMRMAPFPSGPLHIGNARMVILNDEYVKKYKGKLILFYDDTIGSEEKPIDPNAYELIKDGLDWLGVKYHEVYYKSDRMNIYYKYAEELIEKGLAYVCTCPPEIMRKNRRLGIECECRQRSIKENLELWRDMLAGRIKPGKAVLRIKTDMKHPDPAFRDRVIMRISDREHPRVGKKYKVWPMLDFSWAIDDYLLGVTHILRGKELRIEDMMEEYIWEKMGWPKAFFIHYGMLRIKGAKLSKSQNRKLIERGILSGWDDPRTWSLQSLRRRGILPQAIRNFILKLGLSEADITLPAEILYAENRKLLDPQAKRYFAVLNPIEIEIEGAPTHIEINYHPDFPERGKRKIEVGKKIYVEKDDFDTLNGKEVVLIGLGTVHLGKKSIFLGKDIDYTLPKIHWVSTPNIKITIVMPDGSKKVAIADPGVVQLKEGEIVQFYRVGFARLDKKAEKIVFYYAHR